jgi:hypothetical protein
VAPSIRFDSGGWVGAQEPSSTPEAPSEAKQGDGGAAPALSRGGWEWRER